MKTINDSHIWHWWLEKIVIPLLAVTLAAFLGYWFSLKTKDTNNKSLSEDRLNTAISELNSTDDKTIRLVALQEISAYMEGPYRLKATKAVNAFLNSSSLSQTNNKEWLSEDIRVAREILGRTEFRIATFNLENLDEAVSANDPSLDNRIEILQPQLERLRADVICFQEVDSQRNNSGGRSLSTFNKLIEGTPYEKYHKASTETSYGEPYRKCNLVILSRFPFKSINQVKNDYIESPAYRYITAIPQVDEPRELKWERPILYSEISMPNEENIHIINIHLKSRMPTNIPGQKIDFYRWRSIPGWAEGMFVSSMKQVGQALEVRTLVDTIFDNEPKAKIIICGDFNAELHESPLITIQGKIQGVGNEAFSNRVLYPVEKSISMDKRYSFIYHGSKLLFDHIFISRDLMGRFHKAEIHNETLEDETVKGASDLAFPGSDHAPVIASFLYPQGDLGEKP